MKRKIVIVLLLVTLSATGMFAYGGDKGEHEFKRFLHPGFMLHKHGRLCPDAEGKSINDEDAKLAVGEFLNNYLRGYSITNGTKVKLRKGFGYAFEVGDENGNLFLLHVNHCGKVLGPLPAKKVS